MATTLMGAKIQNTVFFKEDVKSRKAAFSSLAKYKKEVMGIKTQLMGLGNIKIKVDGLSKVKSQLAQVKAQAAKAVKPTAAKKAGVGVGGVSDFVGPKKPPLQGVVKQQAIESKIAAAEQKRLDAWLAEGEKKSIAEIRAKRKAADAERKSRLRALRQQEKTASEEKKQAIREEISLNRRSDKIMKFELLPNFRALNQMDRERIVTKLKGLKTEREVTNEIYKQTAALRARAKLDRDRTRQLNKQNFAQERATASMKQMAGAAFSVFTAIQGIGAIAKTGMEMQKVSATMLSVSKDSKEAKENMSFLRKEAHRLGMDRVKAGRAFSKILAARGDLSLEESKKLFTGVSEAGVVSGTSADEMSLQVKALAQMLGKTQVMSEELLCA